MKNETFFRNRRVLPFLRTLKNTVYFTIQQASISGTPDILVCSNGVFLALELKSEKGKVSALQQHNLMEIIRCGGAGLIVKPSNWDEIKTLLKYADTTKGEVDEGTTTGH